VRKALHFAEELPQHDFEHLKTSGYRHLLVHGITDRLLQWGYAQDPQVNTAHALKALVEQVLHTTSEGPD